MTRRLLLSPLPQLALRTGCTILSTAAICVTMFSALSSVSPPSNGPTWQKVILAVLELYAVYFALCCSLWMLRCLSRSAKPGCCYETLDVVCVITASLACCVANLYGRYIYCLKLSWYQICGILIVAMILTYFSNGVLETIALQPTKKEGKL